MEPRIVTMDMKKVKVITKPPKCNLRINQGQKQGRFNVETLPVCQSVLEPERPQVTVHVPPSAPGQHMTGTAHCQILRRNKVQMPSASSPATNSSVTPTDDVPNHDETDSPKFLHGNADLGQSVTSPDNVYHQKPPRAPRVRCQNKQRMQHAPQQSPSSDDSSPGSPLSPSQAHEPTRLQSILHRRVSLMETGKDIDARRSDSGSILSILEGRLDNLPPITSKTVKVFLSSTFSDMVQERNALMEHVYPKLKDVCREQFGLEFQVVDLRWGVREEAQDDHATIDVCLQEIENCKASSVGPSFVAFIGQKYGYRPFPPKINASEFSVLRDVLIEDGQNVSLLDKWYKIDRNTIPSVWVLQPISSILKHYNDKNDATCREADRNEWAEAFRQLQKLLRHAADVAYKLGQITERDREKYFVSVTELEIERGMMALKHPSNHCLCFYRHIKDLEKKVQNPRAQKFIDMLPCATTVDHKAQNLLKVMKARKIENSLFTEKNIRHFHINWQDPEHTDPNESYAYLSDFCEAFYNSMYDLIKSSLHRIADLQKNPNIVEILQHLNMCKSRSEMFRGREDVLGRVLDYLYHPAKEPLVVYGESGSGKTSVVAKAAYLTHRWFMDRKPCVVLRFLGTTVRSCSIRLVLGNICWQIAKLYGEDPTSIPQDYPKLVRYFHRILKVATAEQPLLIFLDSLDQLSSSHRAHSLAWVPQELPENVHLVLSTLPNMFNILDSLHIQIKDPANFIEILPLGKQLSQDLIQEWLRGANRTLTTKQFDIVRDALERCSLPLYTKIIFEEICRWKSYSPPDVTVLEDSVKGVINRLFDRVERYHGKTFVVHALSYLTASRNGLSDNELEDLLSLDDVVLDDVFEHWVPPIRRIPPLLWPRLLNEMSSYIMKREANGIIVFYWYHRQFITVARERFLSDVAHKIFIHTMIAHYFLGTWGGGQQKAFVYPENHLELLGKVKRESLADRKVPPQPLIFSQDASKVVYNMRKLSELPFHLLMSRRSTEMKMNVLFNYEWIHTKLSAMGLQDVLSDFRSTLEMGKDQDVALVCSALRLGGSCINQNPDTLSFDLTSRLLPYYADHLSIRSLIRQCDTISQKHSAMLPIYQCFEAPKRMLLYVLEDHTQMVFDLIFSKFTKELISISKDGTLSFWDMNFGERTRVVDVSIARPGPNTKLYQSCDGQYLIIDSDAIHSPLLVFDLKTGQLKHKVGKKSATSKRAFMSGFLFCRQKNIIDVRTGTIIKTLDDYVETKKFVTCGITPNDKYILIGQDKQTSLFDLEMNVCLAQFEGDNLPCCFVITADSKKAFIGYTDDCVFKVCDIDPQSSTFGQVLIFFNYKDALPHTKFLDGPLFHKELSEISVCERNPNLVLLNVKRCHLILFNLITKFAKLVDVKAINANNNTFLFGANFSMDGRYIVAGSHENLHLWSTENCKLVTTIRLHTNDCFPMAVCTENNLIATGSNIHTAIKVWDLTNVQASEPGSLVKYANPVNMVACAPERRLLFIKLYYDYTSVMGYKYHNSFGIDVFNVSTGTHKNFLPLLSYGILVQMEVSLDGFKMALLLKTRDDTYLIVFNTKTGKVLCTVMHVDAKLFCMSPQWDYAMTLSDKDIPEVILWNLAAGEKVHTFSNCSSPVFTFDSLFVLLVKEKERVIVYSLKQKVITTSLMCEVDSLQVAPNLHRVVLITKYSERNSSDYSLVSLWEFHKGTKIASLYGVAPGGIVDISKDGLRAVDRYLQVFDLKEGSLLCKFSTDNNKLYDFVKMTYDSRCVIWVDGLSVKVGDVTNQRVIANVSLHEKPTSLTLMDFGYIIIIGREDGNIVTLKLMNKGDEKLLQDEKITSMEQRSSSLLDIPACSDGVINTFDVLYRKKPVRIKDHDIPKVPEIQHFLEQKGRVPHAIINSLSFPDLHGLDLQDIAMARRGSSPCNFLKEGSRSGGSTPSSGTPISGSPILLRRKRTGRHRSRSTQEVNDLSTLSRKKSHSLQDIFNIVRTPPSGKPKEEKKLKRKSPMMLKALQQTGQMFMALTDIGSSQSLPRKKPPHSDGGQAIGAEMEKLDMKRNRGGNTPYGRVPSM